MPYRTVLAVLLLFAAVPDARAQMPPPLPAVYGRAPCTDGEAAGFACRNVDLLSFLPPSVLGRDVELVNDHWGWTDPASAREFVIVGGGAPTFVEITDPERPVVVGHLYGGYTQDVKVIGHHAYVMGGRLAGRDVGLRVFDLRRLLDAAAPPVAFRENASFDGFTGAHNLAADERSGFIYAVGGVCGGGMYMVDVRDPERPTAAGCYSGVGYIHDVQCVVYRGPDDAFRGRELCFAAAPAVGLAVIDVTDKAAPVLVAGRGYPNRGYPHQGWLTEDHAHFLMGDEADENGTAGTRTIVWDVTDLADPFVASMHEGRTPAVDHNQYVDGGYLFQANYTAGLSILSLHGLPALAEFAYFDTVTREANGFIGAWSVYPYFPSGVVTVTSRQEGLFVLHPTTITRALPTAVSTPEARAEGRAVRLRWTAAHEFENRGFEIQHQAYPEGTALTATPDTLRPDAWRTIDFVEGAGTSEEARTYTHRIEDLPPGRHAFRIRHVHYLGAARATDPVEVFVLPSAAVLAVYPNPTAGPTSIVLLPETAGAVRVDLYDALGRRVRRLWDGPATGGAPIRLTLDGGALAPGVYHVRAAGASFRKDVRVVVAR